VAILAARQLLDGNKLAARRYQTLKATNRSVTASNNSLVSRSEPAPLALEVRPVTGRKRFELDDGRL
jgi:hypothetical protein